MAPLRKMGISRQRITALNTRRGRINATLARSFTIGSYTWPGRHKWRPYRQMLLFRNRRGRINATLAHSFTIGGLYASRAP